MFIAFAYAQYLSLNLFYGPGSLTKPEYTTRNCRLAVGMLVVDSMPSMPAILCALENKWKSPYYHIVD